MTLCQSKEQNNNQQIVLSWYQHEEIRKNLIEYKILIDSYDSLMIEFEILKLNFKKNENFILELTKNNLKLNKDIVKLEIESNSYKSRIEELENLNNKYLEKINRQSELLISKDKSIISYKSKINNLLKNNRGVDTLKVMVLGLSTFVIVLITTTPN